MQKYGDALSKSSSIFGCFKNMNARWRNQFFCVNIGETLFILSEIARPSKKSNTSCLKSLALGM